MPNLTPSNQTRHGDMTIHSALRRLLQRTQIQFPTLTQWVTIISNFSSRESVTLISSNLHEHRGHSHSAHMCM